MRATTDEHGKVAITLQRGEDRLTFNIGAFEGVAFLPNTEVEIPDERLNAAIDQIGAPFGFSHEDRVWESPVT
jgi:hypothetical protein